MNQKDVLFKNGQIQKEGKKPRMHVRSNTSGGSNKIKMKLHPFIDYSNALKQLPKDGKLTSPTKESLTFSASSNKMRQK